MASRLTPEDRFFRRIESIALSTLPIEELTASSEPPKHHDGVMVAFVPDDPDSLAVEDEGALPPEDLHITLCYLGKVQDLSTFDKTRILSTARRVCEEVGHTFSTNADGVVVMGQNDEGVPATALLVQSDDIVEMYDAMSEALNFKSRFPSFIPHMTTGYGVPVEKAKERLGTTITFSKVIVKFGGDVHSIPLQSAIVAAPRSANVIDRVIDSLGRLWDEALHPRDSKGRFIKKNGAVSGKLAVPTRDRKSVTMVDANRASVVGFHTFGDEIWVLAEIVNDDGSKSQGFARAVNVTAVAPVKARLDALYPIDDYGDAFINSSLERKRQLDLILAYINAEYGPTDDSDGAAAFLDGLGLWKKDLDYVRGDDGPTHLGGIRKVERELDDDEFDEVDDIIEDARTVKELRARVHGLREDADFGFVAQDAHTPPSQKLLQGDAPTQEVIDALNAGKDPLSLETSNLLGAMEASTRFERIVPSGSTGVSPIEWVVDQSDEVGIDARLAGTGRSTTNRAYFVKTSVMGAPFGNNDIVNEVTASLIAENVAEVVGRDDDRLLRIPKSVFGDNPEWDGKTPPDSLDPFTMDAAHQPAHVVSQHAAYLIPPGWGVTDAGSEETSLRNDIRSLDEASQEDQKAAYYEDMGDIYGNSIASMVLWDFALLNGDRNPGNAFLAAPGDGSQGIAVPIDHGFSFDEPYADGDAESTFDWFMQYHFTKAWLAYVRGALDLNNNVSEATLMQIIQNFSDTYGRMDVDQILDAFRAIPGVGDKQISKVEADVQGVLDRVRWIGNNMDTVLQKIVERSN